MIFLTYNLSILIFSEILHIGNLYDIHLVLFFNLFYLFNTLIYKYFYHKNNPTLKIQNIEINIALAILSGGIFSGLYISQNVWDSMSYHLPRYLHWFQNNNLDWFYTSNQRENFSPILPDLLFASAFSLFGSDRIVFLVTWISVLVASIYICKIVKILTDSDKISRLAFLLSLIIPSQIAFMSSTQTDPVSTALVVIALYYVILSRQELVIRSLYALLILIPLFITSKTTGLIFSIPLYLYFSFRHRHYLLANFLKVTALFFLALLPALPYLLRLIRNGLSDGAGVFVTAFSLEGLIANFSRILVSNIQTPIGFVNNVISDGLYGLFRTVGVDLNPTGYGTYGDFYLTSSLHGDLAGNPLHVLVLILSSIWAIMVKKYRWLALLLLIQLTLLSLTIAWQPWINRFTSTLLVLGSILVALWLSSLKNFYKNLMLSILIMYSSFWVFFNPARAILNPQPLVAIAETMGLSSEDLPRVRWDLALPREQQYFSVRPEIQDSYLGAINMTNLNSSDILFLNIGGDDFEYPIWALTNFEVQVYHFDDSSKQRRVMSENNAYLFCTVDCTNLGFTQEYSSEFVTLWSNS